MSGCGGGARLYALLASLDYPALAGLSAEGLDWVWEQEECHQFLSWLVNSLGPDQLISTQDLATYSALPPTSQLAEPLLSAALATCASQDGELSERELEQAVAELEEELELQVLHITLVHRFAIFTIWYIVLIGSRFVTPYN